MSPPPPQDTHWPCACVRTHHGRRQMKLNPAHAKQCRKCQCKRPTPFPPLAEIPYSATPEESPEFIAMTMLKYIPTPKP